ncbi:MAG: SRPBCC family protein [Anaerolineales bacterium]
MQSVERNIWLPYSPKTVYECLTNPDDLASIVGRIAAVQVIEREGDVGRVAVTLDMPMRKVVKTTGEVIGLPYEQLTFTTHEPFPLTFIWRLEDAPQDAQPGTRIHASLGFDLSMFGVPVAGSLIEGIVGSELEDDLQRLTHHIAAQAP